MRTTDGGGARKWYNLSVGAGGRCHHLFILLHDRQSDGQAGCLRDRMGEERERGGRTQRSTEK